MSEPAFLRRGVEIRVHRIADIAPSLKKGMAQTLRDAESSDFRVLQPIATVCEQSATFSVVGWRLQQIATYRGSEDGSQATKNPAVEHKGLSDELVVFGLYLGDSTQLRVSADSADVSATRLTGLSYDTILPGM